MSSLELAEEAVERLSPEELEEFLRWFSGHAGAKLESLRDPDRPMAQELAEAYEAKVRSGEAKPFGGIDLTAWPAAAREKAEALIADWEAKHGE